MQAFNHYFYFVDAPQLSQKCDNRLPLVQIKEHQGEALSALFSLRSPWVSMTQREVRYYTNTPFEDLSTPTIMWALEIGGLFTLIWYAKNKEIHYIKAEGYSDKLLQFWVLHTFFPLVLELERRYHVLHVSGVKLKHKTLLFSAYSGGGKSTLVEYFIGKGHGFYGDDTVAVEEDKKGYKVISSYPFCRPYRKPEVLGYHVLNFVQTVDLLSSVYLLERVEADAKVNIVPLYGIEKFEVLYKSKFVSFESMKQERYLFASKMANHVEVFKISIPWKLERLDEVYQAILMHNGV